MKKSCSNVSGLVGCRLCWTGCQKEEVEKLVATACSSVQETPEALGNGEEKNPAIPEIDTTLSIESGARIG